MKSKMIKKTWYLLGFLILFGCTHLSLAVKKEGTFHFISLVDHQSSSVSTFADENIRETLKDVCNAINVEFREYNWKKGFPSKQQINDLFETTHFQEEDIIFLYVITSENGFRYYNQTVNRWPWVYFGGAGLFGNSSLNPQSLEANSMSAWELFNIVRNKPSRFSMTLVECPTITKVASSNLPMNDIEATKTYIPPLSRNNRSRAGTWKELFLKTQGDIIISSSFGYNEYPRCISPSVESGGGGLFTNSLIEEITKDEQSTYFSWRTILSKASKSVTDYTLAEGRNSLRDNATRNSKQQTPYYAFFPKSDNDMPNWAANPKQTYMISVGVSDYAYESMFKSKIQYADDDAVRMRSLFHDSRTISTNAILLKDSDATKRNIINTCNSHFEQADENDLIILYMAGHGNEEYFMPYDYDVTNITDDKKIAYNDIFKLLAKNRTSHKVLIVSSCKFGAVETDCKRIEIENRGVAIISAATVGEDVIEDPDNDADPFTYYLSIGLDPNTCGDNTDMNNDYVITLNEAYEYAKRRTAKELSADRQPTFCANELGRNIILLRCKP
jgi:hypothetical protein